MDHEADRTESPRAWWRRRLARLDAVLDLPADRPRTPGVEPRTERLSVRAGGRGGCLETLDMVAPRPSRDVDRAVLLAGVAALCGQLTGRAEVALGTAVPGLDGGSGLAVLRFRVAAGMPFGELLGQAREQVTEAVRWGPVPRDLAGAYPRGWHPLAQVVVAVRGPGEPAPDLVALRLAPEAPAFDLAWVLDRAASPAILVLEHDASRFERSAPVFLGRLQSLLTGGLADPGTPLASLAAGSPPVA